MESINPCSISVPVVYSVVTNSWSKNIGFIGTSGRDIVKTISLCWLGVGCGICFSFWRDICLVLGCCPLLDRAVFGCCCPILLSSVSSNTVTEKVNSVGYRPARIKACFMDQSSCFSKAEVVLVDFVCKLPVKSSFFAVLLNSIDNVLDHISFITRCRPLLVSSFKIIFWVFKGW